MSAIAVATIEGLQRNIASLIDRIIALPRRFSVSDSSLDHAAQQLSGGITVASLEPAFDCGALAQQLGKALEADAEEARVRAAQLEAYATLFEREAEEGEEEQAVVIAAAQALLFSSASPAPDSRFVIITAKRASCSRAVAVAVRVRDGFDPLGCILSGKGVHMYQIGDNQLTLRVVDGDGAVVESIEAEDVRVSVSAEGASVTRVVVVAPGTVEVAYGMPECSVEPVVLGVSVCGVALPGSPRTVIRDVLEYSAVLTDVAPERAAAFLRELCVWLPDRSYSLLYRGSRDGMDAKAFHRSCDGKGPTLVLVRSDQGWVFGGYSGASWDSPPWAGFGTGVVSPDAFLFSVLGPHTAGPVQFPVVDPEEVAIRHHTGSGPVFYGGLSVVAKDAAPMATFDDASNCNIASTGFYKDVLGQGSGSMTGSKYFTPTEVEVFAVVPA